MFLPIIPTMPGDPDHRVLFVRAPSSMPLSTPTHHLEHGGRVLCGAVLPWPREHRAELRDSDLRSGRLCNPCMEGARRLGCVR